MNLRTKLTSALTVALLAATCLPASAFPIGKKKAQPAQDGRKLTPAQSALVDRAIAREALVVKTVREKTPLVETYIQNMRPDPVMGQSPESDLHFLLRVDFGKVINDVQFATDKSEGKKTNVFKHSLQAITGLSNALHLTFHASGFVQMLLVDSKDFNRNMYQFYFLRNDFLGTIPTVVFDVQPTKHNALGRFAGRIWIDRNSGNIVRFNGDFAGSTENQQFFHFDSWRTNVQEGLWLPTSVYCEETDPKSPTHSLKFKAINYIWGYSLKNPAKDADETSLTVENAVDESANAADVSPLQAQREWIQQAEDNVLDRLFTAGLIDAPSDFDKTLAALANNILAYNNIPTSRPLKVRTLLTEPLESVAIGNTILLSKSLIDTTAIQSADGAQQMGDLNALLAFQVAHIILGHHIDTKYAFSDRLLFPSESAFQRLPMHHIDADNTEAAKKAMELLSVKDLADGQKYFSLYLQQLQAREKSLTALTTPQLGDSMIGPDGNFWMQAIISKGPKLNNTDLKQQAAMPLSAFLRFDPWTDQVIQMHTSYEPLLSARDKLPFEITPVYLKLTYYTPPAATPTDVTAPTPAPQPTPAPTGDATPAPGATTPAATTPAATTPTATTPATGTSTPPQ
jgi:hypothetical protein